MFKKCEEHLLVGIDIFIDFRQVSCYFVNSYIVETLVLFDDTHARYEAR